MIQGHYLWQIITVTIAAPLLFLTLLVAVMGDVYGKNGQLLPVLSEKGQIEPTGSRGLEEAVLENITDEASCRVGVVARGSEHVKWVDDLGAGWFVFFGGFSDSATNDAQIVPVIDVQQKKDAQGNYLDDFEISPSMTEEGLGALIDFNYDTEPLPGSFPFPGIGPYDLLKESRMNHYGKLMFRWIYWHILLKGKEMPIDSPMTMAGKKME